MKLAHRLRRHWLLRSTPRLATTSPEGAVVQAVGRAYALEDEDLFAPPVSGKSCVVAWTKITTGDSGDRLNPLVHIERMHVRPFELECDDVSVIVDTSHLVLLLPVLVEGRTREISVQDGETVTVIGTVLRDGIERPADDDTGFRDVESTIRIVGNKRHPVVITAPR